MVKLQHRTRRAGTINVAGTVYTLNDKGEVEVSEEHAEAMLQGACWGHAGVWAAEQKAAAAPEVIAGARRPRTAQELAAVAGVAGVQVEEKPKPTPVVTRRKRSNRRGEE